MDSVNQGQFLCPHCQESFALSSDSAQSIACCPHCSQELFLAELETKINSNPSGERVSFLPETKTLGGEYEMGKLLGRGGMGAVYLAKQLSLDRLVAVKILPPSLSEDSHFVHRFQREAETMAALDHPNLVRVLDRGKEGNIYYFVMEYVEGPSLLEAMKGKAITWQEKCEILLQVCKGLAYAHEKGVIHRDIKPGNILLGQDGSVKISDFGLARLLSGSTVAKRELTELTATEMVLGTFRYMAPEQKHSSKKVDQRADLFALGVMAYEFFTGKEPSGCFALPSQLNAELPRRMDSLIQKALQPDPKDRFQRVEEMAKELELILEGKEEPAPPKEKSAKQVMVKFLLGSQLGCSIAITLSLVFVLAIPLFSRFLSGPQAETAKLSEKNWAVFSAPAEKKKGDPFSDEATKRKSNSPPTTKTILPHSPATSGGGIPPGKTNSSPEPRKQPASSLEPKNTMKIKPKDRGKRVRRSTSSNSGGWGVGKGGGSKIQSSINSTAPSEKKHTPPEEGLGKTNLAQSQPQDRALRLANLKKALQFTRKFLKAHPAYKMAHLFRNTKGFLPGQRDLLLKQFFRRRSIGKYKKKLQEKMIEKELDRWVQPQTGKSNSKSLARKALSLAIYFHYHFNRRTAKGKELAMLGQTAHWYYRKALELSPGDALPQYLQAFLFRRQGKESQFFKSLTEALFLDHKLEKYERAEEIYETLKKR